MAGEAEEELRRLINENVEAVAALRAQHYQRASRSVRFISGAIRRLARPATVYGVVAFAAIWVALNLVLKLGFDSAFDPPPFSGLQTLLAFGALLTAVMVLVEQRYDRSVIEHRSELLLQIQLLLEERSARSIRQIEDFRRDLKGIEPQGDRIIRALSRTANPEEIVKAIQDALHRAEREAGLESDAPFH